MRKKADNNVEKKTTRREIKKLKKSTEIWQDEEWKPKNKFWRVVYYICLWIYRLRSILLAIPVAAMAIGLALENISRLPEEVGISLQASGEFSMVITRDLAVLGPLGITAVCLLMMFCSKRVIYPWLISIFSLILPYVLWITNVFPT